MAGRTVARSAARVAPCVLLAPLLLGSAANGLTPRTFYVDFAGGNDAADGISPTTAWKRAPGDPAAGGKPKAVKLMPGDHLLFKGDVRYRGTIQIQRNGSADRPIVYDGSGWGSNRAIMDGSNAVGAAQPCPSQRACLGSEHWRNLMFVSVPANARWNDWLFVNDHAMQTAQWPSVTDYWDYDNVSKMASVPLAKLPELQAGFIAVTGIPAKLMAGSPVLGQWSNINDIHTARSFQIQKDGISFVSPSYKPYTNRDNRFTIYNVPSEVNAPGKFAISGKDGIAIFWPQAPDQRRATAGASVGARRHGFTFGSVSHVQIRGFGFTNFASPQFGEGLAAGEGNLPILAGVRVQHVEIVDNSFRSIVDMTRGAAIRMTRGSEISIMRNRFEHLPWASAIYLGRMEGPVRIQCNSIENIGRNGVRILDNMDTRIEGNFITGVNNIHGAGINLYLDNRYAMVRGNVIHNSSLPLTMHGTAKPYFATAEPVDIHLVGNVFISNSAGAAAISSWGTKLHNVQITDNFLGSERVAVRFSGDERNIMMANNTLVGSISKPASTQLTETANVMMAVDSNGRLAMVEAAKNMPSKDYCNGIDPKQTMSAASSGR